MNNLHSENEFGWRDDETADPLSTPVSAPSAARNEWGFDSPAAPSAPLKPILSTPKAKRDEFGWEVPEQVPAQPVTPPAAIAPVVDPIQKRMPPAVDEFGFGTAPSEPEPVKSSVLRRYVGDPAAALAKGLVSVPQAMVGLADIPTLGRAGKMVDSVIGGAAKAVGSPIRGFQDVQAFYDTLLTPEQQQDNRAVAEADGFLNTVKAAIQNPSTIVQTTVESVPSMVGGAALGRKLVSMFPRLSPMLARVLAEKELGVAQALVGGALGEGLISAGQSVEQIREPGGTLTGKQVALGAGSGVATALLGLMGGKLAKRLGFDDVDVLFAGGARTEAKKNILRRVIEGAISEGAFEELPQSLQEQVAQNLATGKPAGEGVAKAGALGMLAGAAMGGGANLRPQFNPPAQPAPHDPAAAMGRDPEAAQAAAQANVEELQRAADLETLADALGQDIPAEIPAPVAPLSAVEQELSPVQPLQPQPPTPGAPNGVQEGQAQEIAPPPTISAPAVPLAVPDQPQPAPAREAVSGPGAPETAPDAMPPIRPGADSSSPAVTPEAGSTVQGSRFTVEQPQKAPELMTTAEYVQAFGRERKGMIGGSKFISARMVRVSENDVRQSDDHGAALWKATQSQKPVLAESWDDSKLPLPAGYVRDGDLYVFLGGKKTAPESPMARQGAETAQGAGGAEIAGGAQGQAAGGAVQPQTTNDQLPTISAMKANGWSRADVAAQAAKEGAATINPGARDPWMGFSRSDIADRIQKHRDAQAKPMPEKAIPVKTTNGANAANEQTETVSPRNTRNERKGTPKKGEPATWKGKKGYISARPKLLVKQGLVEFTEDGSTVGKTVRLKDVEVLNESGQGDSARQGAPEAVPQQGEGAGRDMPKPRDMPGVPQGAEGQGVEAGAGGFRVLKTKPNSTTIRWPDGAKVTYSLPRGDALRTAQEDYAEQQRKKQAPTENAKKKRRGYKGYIQETGLTPVVDFIAGTAGIRPRRMSKYKGGEYDDAPEFGFLGGFGRVIWAGENHNSATPDLMAMYLFDAGLLSEASPSEMWSKIGSEISSYRRLRKDQGGSVRENWRDLMPKSDRDRLDEQEAEEAKSFHAYADRKVREAIEQQEILPPFTKVMDGDGRVATILHIRPLVSGNDFRTAELTGKYEYVLDDGRVVGIDYVEVIPDFDAEAAAQEAEQYFETGEANAERTDNRGEGTDLRQIPVEVPGAAVDEPAAGERPGGGGLPGGVAEASPRGADRDPAAGETPFGLESTTPAQLQAEADRQAQRAKLEAMADKPIVGRPEADFGQGVLAGTGGEETLFNVPARRAVVPQDTDTLRAEAKATGVSTAGTRTDLEKRLAEKGGDRIEDFGEKIGGARKDTAEKGGGRTGRAKPADDGAPAWRKRFVTAESISTPGEWSILDAKDKFGGMGRRGQTFPSQEAAEAAIPLYAAALTHTIQYNSDGTHSIYKKVGDRKRLKVVQQDFASREEAMTYLAKNAETLLNAKTSFGEEILPVPDIAKRTGVSRRTGDATRDLFVETFNPRAIEFGLWENQEERQMVMNHAYDGLLDLAEALGVPPKALMLNGELAIAFGARGQGLTGAKAHYETDYGVINLTKMKGAGSLAHEWMHAFDHYLARKDGKASSAKQKNERGDLVYPKASDRYTLQSHGNSLGSKLREELRTSYTALIQGMFKKAEQYVEDTTRADDFLKMAKKNLREKLDGARQYLARDDSQWKKNKFGKPATADQLAQFDRLADILMEGGSLKLDKWVKPENDRSRFGTGRQSNDVLESMSAIFKAARGRSGFSKQYAGPLNEIAAAMTTYAERIRLLGEAQQGTGRTRMRTTDYAIEAKKMDQARSGDYWSEPHEMVARAFASYVEDKLAATGGQSDFLVYHARGGILLPMIDGFVARPYPEGSERVEINRLFDEFVTKIQTRETDRGVEMFAAKPGSFVKFTTLPTRSGGTVTFSMVTDENGGWDIQADQKPEYQRILLEYLEDNGFAMGTASGRMEAGYGTAGENEARMAGREDGGQLPAGVAPDGQDRGAVPVRDRDGRRGQLPGEESGGVQAPVGSGRSVASDDETVRAIESSRRGLNGRNFAGAKPDAGFAQSPQFQAAADRLAANGTRKVHAVRGLKTDAVDLGNGEVMLNATIPAEKLAGVAGHENLHRRVAKGDVRAKRLVGFYRAGTAAAKRIETRLINALAPAIGREEAKTYVLGDGNTTGHAAEEAAAMAADYATQGGGRTALGLSRAEVLDAFGVFSTQADNIAKAFAEEDARKTAAAEAQGSGFGVQGRAADRFAAVDGRGRTGQSSGMRKGRNMAENIRWWHGARPQNVDGDQFYSADESVAGDYGDTRPMKPNEMPTNPLVVSDKTELAGMIGFKGDPFSQPLTDPKAKQFDFRAKAWAKTRGYDGILYLDGSFNAEELHVFKAEPRKGAGSQDRDYLAAVERGDMATAQRIVDEAAKRAGYTVGPVWHGTLNDWTVFDIQKAAKNEYEINSTGISVAYDPKRAESFGGRHNFLKYERKPVRVLKLYAKAANTYDLRNKAQRDAMAMSIVKDGISNTPTGELQKRYAEWKSGKAESFYEGVGENRDIVVSLKPRHAQKSWTTAGVEKNFKAAGEISFEEWLPLHMDAESSTLSDHMRLAKYNWLQNENRKLLKDNGYDSAFTWEDSQDGDADRNLYLIDPSQIKSAEPIVRDNKGRIIPPSERFNPQSADIRYSATPEAGEPAKASQSEWDAATVQEYTTAGAKRRFRVVENGKTIQSFFGTAETAERFIIERKARMDEDLAAIMRRTKKDVAEIAEARRKLDAELSNEKLVATDVIDAMFKALSRLDIMDAVHRKEIQAEIRRTAGERKTDPAGWARRTTDRVWEIASRISYMKELREIFDSKQPIRLENGTVQARPKYDAFVNQWIAKAKEYADLTQDQVRERMETMEADTEARMANRAENETVEMDEAVRDRALLATFGGLFHGADYAKAKAAFEAANALVREGRDKFMEIENHRKLVAAAKRIQIQEEAKAGKQIDDTEAELLTRNKSIWEILTSAGNWWHSKVLSGPYLYNQAGDTRSGVKDMSGAAVEQYQKEVEAVESEEQLMEEVREDVVDILSTEIGLKDPSANAKEAQQFSKTLHGWRQNQKGGTGIFLHNVIRNKDGSVKRVEQGAELRNSPVILWDMWLTAKRAESAAKQKFSNEPQEIEGGFNSMMEALVDHKITAETVQMIEKNLDPRLIRVGWKLLDYMRNHSRPQVEAMGFRLLGAVPPMYGDLYFPTSRRNDRRKVAGGRNPYTLIMSFMKPLVPNNLDFKWQDPLEKFISHFEDLNHVVSHIDVVDEQNRIFNHPEMQNTLRVYRGEALRAAVNNHLDRLTLGGEAGMADSIMRWFRSMFARSVIPNPTQAPKQFSSLTMFSTQELPPGANLMDWFVGVGKALASPRAAKQFNALLNQYSVRWRDRYEHGYNQQVREARRGATAGDLLGKRMAWFEFMNAFPQFGDKASSLIGGRPIYELWFKHYSEVEKNPPVMARERAMKRFMDAVDLTQQSGSTPNLSDSQVGFMANFMMFKTQPTAMTRLWMNSVRNLALKRGTTRENVWNMTAIVISQMLFQAVSDAFFIAAFDDPDEWKRLRHNQLRAAVFAPINGYLILPEALLRLTKIAMKDKVYGEFAGDVSSYLDVVNDVENLMRIFMDEEDMTGEDWLDATQAAGSIVGATTGKPVAPTIRWVRGIGDAITDDTLSPAGRAARAVGYGKQAAGQDKERATPPSRPKRPWER